MLPFIADVAYAIRTFHKKPAFAITAIATLALGIGATAAIFSVVDAVLLTPLPYRAPARLVHVWQDMRNHNVSDFPWPPPAKVAEGRGRIRRQAQSPSTGAPRCCWDASPARSCGTPGSRP